MCCRLLTILFLLRVMMGVRLARFGRMVIGMVAMARSAMGMMSGAAVIVFLVVARGFAVMVRGLFVMIGGILMVLASGMFVRRHGVLP